MERLDRTVRQRIFDALDRFVADPGHADRRKLQGQADEWRLRVGDYRVRYQLDTLSRVVVVLRVLPRSTAYRR
ncbi:MAG: type II toxin-antitoxin system RelE/ParE family toxin [Chloroflexi bacterium]|nr:type II toxin-antitoxin system RelE/ParE family toxin [Chloroflexota bacterium]